ncbi:hypothetical protein VTO42DRAFT_6875 [Malbranchea cinnamomea]
MDHVPDDVSAAPRRPSYRGRSSFAHTSPSPPSASQPDQREKAFSQQNRRLQLRNTGFRGVLLSSTQITPQLPGWRSPSPRLEPDENKENSRPSVTSTSPHNQGRISSLQIRSVSNILLELNNSTQTRTSKRPSAAGLFMFSSPSPSSCNRSPPLSPSPDDGRTSMKIRESSWNSPFGSLDRPKRREDSTRAPRRDTSRYIEHLESQLAATLNRVDDADSPVYTAQASKIKSLTAELRALRQELAGWEERFEARVREEIGSMMERETKFRVKIRALEKDVEAKDNKIRELEWEVEMGNRRLRNLEAIKSTNRNLERRVDVLTELLAHAPLRTEPEPIASPESNPTTSTPRPKSMFSRIPLSPVRRPLFQSATEPQSIPSILEQASTPPDGSAEGPFAHSRGLSCVSMESCLDSGLGDSCSQMSTRTLESQRSSMVSNASSNPPFWGTSFPLSPDFQAKLQHRQRQMRRFPSGSHTLKPLILPAAAGALSPPGNLLSPTHAEETPRGRRWSRDIAQEDDHLPPKAHEATLHALEGSTRHFQTFEEAISGHTLSDAVGANYSPVGDETPAHQVPDTSPYLTAADSSGGLVRRSSCLSPQFSIMDTLRRARHMSKGDLTPRSIEARPVSPDVPPPTPPSRPLPFATDLAAELIWLPIRYIKDYFLHSSAIARRILINAWHANWTTLRRFSWWIFGVVLGRRRRNAWFFKMPGDGIMPGSRQQPRNHPYLGCQCISCKTHLASGTRLPVEPAHPVALTTSPDDKLGLCKSPSASQRLARSIQLWTRFSLVLVLAVGLAMRDGPASLMCECLRYDVSPLNSGSGVETTNAADTGASTCMARTLAPSPLRCNQGMASAGASDDGEVDRHDEPG